METTKQFRTTRLPLAVLLHCTQKLTFAGCELDPSGKALFVFDDEESQGENIELEFDRGKAQVDARAFVTSERFLKRKMYQLLQGRG